MPRKNLRRRRYDIPEGMSRVIQAVCGLAGLVILGYHGFEGQHTGLDGTDVTGTALTLGAAGAYFLRMLRG